jgi:RimJ/RimL family protein N-acetyltransferase
MNSPDTPEASDYALAHPGYHELDVTYSDTSIHIRLIEPDLSHAHQSLAWLQQRDIGQYMGTDFSKVSMDTEVERLQDIINTTDEYNWMIEVNGQVVGNVNISDIDLRTKTDSCRSGSMTILIGDRESWGKGIGQSVNSAVIDWAFHEAGFDRLHAQVLIQNLRSIKSFTALGFKQTGVTEEKADDGTIEHWNQYFLTKEQWRL